MTLWLRLRRTALKMFSPGLCQISRCCFLPLALSLQQQVDELPDGSFTAPSAGDITNLILDPRLGTRSHHGETAAPQHGKIHDIVSHVSHFPVGKLVFL